MTETELADIRQKISAIDDSIIDLLIERFKLTDEVGRIKKSGNIPIENKEKKISDSELMTLMLLLLISISIWVWAFYELVINFKNLPDWAKIIGILGLTLNNIAGGMFLTIFVVYIGKNEGSLKKNMIYE